LNGLFTDDDTSALGEATIDSTDGVIGALNFDQEDGFLEARLSSELSGVEDSSGSWGNLTTTSVNSVGVQSDVLNVEADASHVLL